MLINKPTRFPIGLQKGKPSCLDHLYTNVPEDITSLGIIISDLSDHSPIFSLINAKPKKLKGKNIFVRNYTNFDNEKFCSTLSKYSEFRLEGQSIDEKFHNFQKYFEECVNTFVPLRKLTRKEVKFKIKPWLTKGIQKSIQKKNHLYKLLRYHNRIDLEWRYKMYKTTISKLIHKSKKKLLYLSN